MIPLVVPRFFPTPYDENKLESSLNADASVVKAPASCDLSSFNSDSLGVNEYEIEMSVPTFIFLWTRRWNFILNFIWSSYVYIYNLSITIQIY